MLPEIFASSAVLASDGSVNGADAAPIAIVGAASDRYAPHLTVSLHSALARIDRRRAVRVFVLDGGFSRQSRARLEASLAGAHPLAKVEIIAPGADVLDGLPTCERYPLATYLQLVIPQVLPDDLERVLYIDSDVVVTEDISPLFDRGLDGRALWAVRDSEVDGNLGRLKHGFPEVWFVEGAQYINTGVLLMHLPLWRRERIAERALEVLRTRGALCVWKNQDAINVALAGDWGLLPDKWNNRLRGHTWAFPHLAQAKDGEGILHFCGHRKPWRGWCIRDDAYYDALLASGWPGPVERLLLRLNEPYRRARAVYQIARRRLALRSRLRQMRSPAPAHASGRP